MSSEQRGKKRSKKAYYRKCAKKINKGWRHELDSGMSGFLVTCNSYEREAVKEMYNILGEYADDKFGPEQLNKGEKTPDDAGEMSDEENSDEDMEKAMKREITEIKQVVRQERRFQNVNTKTKNCIFIKTTLEDPCSIAHDIFTELVQSQQQKTRYAIRMIPVSITCKTNLPEIKSTAEKLFKPHFETAHGVGLKFTSVSKIRNNESISRLTLLPALSHIIYSMNPLHSLNHDEPDLVVIIEIIRNICCLSVVKDFYNFRKYNFHEVLVKKDKTNQGETVPKNQEKDEDTGTNEKEDSDESKLNLDKKIDLNETGDDDGEEVKFQENAEELQGQGEVDSLLQCTDGPIVNEKPELSINTETKLETETNKTVTNNSI